MGIKRKNSNKAASSDVSPSNSNVNGLAGNVIMAHDVSVTHLQMIEEFLSNEEAYISQFLSVISQVSDVFLSIVFGVPLSEFISCCRLGPASTL